MELPAVKQQKQTVWVEQTAPFGGTRCADGDITVGCPRLLSRADQDIAELSGAFGVLYYDSEGQLQAGNVHYQQEEPVEDSGILWCMPKGRPQILPGMDSMALKGELTLHQISPSAESVTMLAGLTVGEQTQKNPDRPSLILKRPGQQDLWTLAKENGSTVEAIQQANHLQGEPEAERMLLIPVL